MLGQSVLSVYRFKSTHRHSHGNALNDAWPYPWTPRGPVRLTHRINCDKWLSPSVWGGASQT